MLLDIISKIKEAGLIGCGGAGFPTWQKWETVKNATAEKKFVVANGSEGEIDIWKDGYILENYPVDLVDGIKLAMKEVGAIRGYLYLRHDYFKKFKKNVEKVIGDAAIEIFEESGGYIGGEETALINSLEGKRCEPRMKPPKTSEKGLFGYPTLINNIETLYWVAKIFQGDYQKNRFYSIGGQVKNPGVYQFSTSASIKEILEKTNNYPNFPFFLQVGGGSSGEILTEQEINQFAGGAGGIKVLYLEKEKLINLARQWSSFFLKESCGQCLPCREGVYRLKEILFENDLNQEKIVELFFALKQTSFCGFGRSVPIPFETLINKIWKKK